MSRALVASRSATNRYPTLIVLRINTWPNRRGIVVATARAILIARRRTRARQFRRSYRPVKMH